jgi:hypothetical protein
MDLREIWWEVVDWMQLDQDRDRWRTFVNVAMHLGFHKRREISWLAEWLLASQEGLCYMGLISSLDLSSGLLARWVAEMGIRGVVIWGAATARQKQPTTSTEGTMDQAARWRAGHERTASRNKRRVPMETWLSDVAISHDASAGTAAWRTTLRTVTNWLNPWSRVILRKVVITQLAKKISLPFMEPEGLLLCS